MSRGALVATAMLMTFVDFGLAVNCELVRYVCPFWQAPGRGASRFGSAPPLRRGAYHLTDTDPACFRNAAIFAARLAVLSPRGHGAAAGLLLEQAILCVVGLLFVTIHQARW